MDNDKNIRVPELKPIYKAKEHRDFRTLLEYAARIIGYLALALCVFFGSAYSCNADIIKKATIYIGGNKEATLINDEGETIVIDTKGNISDTMEILKEDMTESTLS